MADERLVFDTFSALLLLVTALVGAWVPRYLSSKADGSPHPHNHASLAFHLGNMLSGGVMLSAGFCHLLADSLREVAFIGRFPIATFLAASGYIVTLVADQVVQHVAENSGSGGSGGAHGGSQPHWGAYAPPAEQGPLGGGGGGRPRGAGGHSPAAVDFHESPPPEEDSEAEGEGVRLVVRTDGYASVEGAHVRSVTPRNAAAGAGGGLGAAPDRSRPPPPPPPPGSAGGGGAKLLHAASDGAAAPPPAALSLSLSPRRSVGGGVGNGCCALPPPRRSSGDAADAYGHPAAGGHGAHNHAAQLQVILGQRKLTFATAVLLALALCIHSVLEGIALGAQESMRATEDIMIAIAAHKGLAAYALGASIVESKASPRKFWTVVSLFACATPLGIAVGYLFSEVAPGRVAASMSALASGTFLYVAMMEVIPKELEDGRHRLPKMGMLLLGFGLMSLLAVWA